MTDWTYILILTSSLSMASEHPMDVDNPNDVNLVSVIDKDAADNTSDRTKRKSEYDNINTPAAKRPKTDVADYKTTQHDMQLVKARAEQIKLKGEFRDKDLTEFYWDLFYNRYDRRLIEELGFDYVISISNNTILFEAVDYNCRQFFRDFRDEILSKEYLLYNDDRANIFHQAALNGFTSFVRELSPLYPDLVQQKDNDGRTIFHEAAAGGFTSFVRELSPLYPDLVQQKDNDGRTIFHAATNNSQQKFIQELAVLFPQLVREKDNDGNPIFHQIMRSGCSEEDYTTFITDLTYAYPDLIKLRDRQNRTILDSAHENQHSYGFITILSVCPELLFESNIPANRTIEIFFASYADPEVDDVLDNEIIKKEVAQKVLMLYLIKSPSAFLKNASFLKDNESYPELQDYLSKLLSIAKVMKNFDVGNVAPVNHLKYDEIENIDIDLLDRFFSGLGLDKNYARPALKKAQITRINIQRWFDFKYYNYLKDGGQDSLTLFEQNHPADLQTLRDKLSVIDRFIKTCEKYTIPTLSKIVFKSLTDRFRNLGCYEPNHPKKFSSRESYFECMHKVVENQDFVFGKDTFPNNYRLEARSAKEFFEKIMKPIDR